MVVEVCCLVPSDTCPPHHDTSALPHLIKLVEVYFLLINMVSLT